MLDESRAFLASNDASRSLHLRIQPKNRSVATQIAALPETFRNQQDPRPLNTTPRFAHGFGSARIVPAYELKVNVAADTWSLWRPVPCG